MTKILFGCLHLFLQASDYHIDQKAQSLLWELNFTIYKCISSVSMSWNVLIKGQFCSSLTIWSFPDSSVSKESTCNAGYLGSVPGLGRSAGGGHGNPLQDSCLENPRDRGAWRTPWGPKESDTTEQLHNLNLILLAFSFLCFISLSSSWLQGHLLTY